MRSRRELFTWMLPPSDPAPPERPPSERPRSERPAPDIPPEIAARAARFRAEREARASAIPPVGRIHWMNEEPPPAPLADGPRVAVVSRAACLNAGADFCATCVERCPEPGAIHLDGRHITVEAARCTGCGICVTACPAPGGALRLSAAPPAP